MNPVPETVCTLPWTGFSNDPDGRVRPCCLYKGHITNEAGAAYYMQKHSMSEIFNSPYMKRLRQKFLKGEKPAECSTCWIDESNNYRSKRLIYFRSEADLKANYNIRYSDDTGMPQEFQLIISNKCNLKCRSCTPSHSTEHQIEQKQLHGETGYPMPHKQVADVQSVFWENRKEWYKTLKKLEIVGGEPFLIDRWKIIWDELIDLKLSRQITLSFSTNATVFDEVYLRKIIENFPVVNFSLSIDGLGETFEYLRYPAKWNVVSENIQKYHRLLEEYKRPGLGLRIGHTISSLNLPFVPEFHEFIYTNYPDAYIWNNPVHWPIHLSPWNLPEKSKQNIREKWARFSFQSRYQDDINAILTLMDSRKQSDDDRLQAHSYLSTIDQIRRENFSKTFPHLGVSQ